MTATQLGLSLDGPLPQVDAPTRRNQHHRLLVALYHEAARGLSGEEAAQRAGITLTTTASTRLKEMATGEDDRFPIPLVWQSEFKHRKTASGKLATTWHLNDAGRAVAHDLATRGEGCVNRGKGTEKTWPTETADELVARIRREYGDAVADLVLADLAATHERRKKVPERVGNKPKRPAALPKLKPRGVAWTERRDHDAPDFVPGRDGAFPGRLPRSGAGPIPKARPRTASERKPK